MQNAAPPRSSSDTTVKQRDDDPSESMWSVYMNQIEKHNKVTAESWRADMNSILIFAGLFSSSLTTFIVESYQTLSPPTPDPALATVLQLLLSQSNSSVSFPLMSQNGQVPFKPSTSALICNILWFASLVFSLICALSATMVDQWARNYILATESRPSLHKRARISAYLYRGIRIFKMNTVVELIPTLLHISLFLFFAGLFAFLQPINAILSFLILGMLLFCGSLYLLATFLPIFISNCPYYTPLSSLWWHFMRRFGLVRREYYPLVFPQPIESMAEAREADATEISPERDDRDFEAMRWTLSTLREDAELEPLLGFIPQLVSGFDYSAKLLLHKLLKDGPDPALSLGYRLPRLLSSCADGTLSPSFAYQRATICLHAIWSLTMMAVPLPTGPIPPTSSRPSHFSRSESLAFDEGTLNSIRAAKAQIPSLVESADSTASVVARSLLDMFMDGAVTMENELAAFLRTGHWPSQHTVRTRTGRDRDVEWAPRRALFAKKKVQRELNTLEQVLCSLDPAQSHTAPAMYVVMEEVRQYLDDLMQVVIIASSSEVKEEPDRISSLAEDTLEFVRIFQRILNEAGFFLTLEYISTLVHSPAALLPYEAFNTLRRLFLKINFDYAFPTSAQSQLALHLDIALEPHPARGGRLPASVINILLALAGNAFTDPGYTIKARGAISDYLHVLTPPVLVTRDAALKAISQLDAILPDDSRPLPVSDLLSAHVYANTKLDRKATPNNLVDIGVDQIRFSVEGFGRQ